MATSQISMYVNIFAIMQTMVLTSENLDLKNKYLTNSRLFDFVPGDTVTCTLVKGYFRIQDIHEEDLIITSLTEPGPTHLVRPEFLKKIKVDPRWIKVLYEDRSG